MAKSKPKSEISNPEAEEWGAFNEQILDVIKLTVDHQIKINDIDELTIQFKTHKAIMVLLRSSQWA